jgi:hypothetical protein
MNYTLFNEQEALHVFGLLDQMHTKRSTQVRNTGYLKKYASDLSHDCDKTDLAGPVVPPNLQQSSSQPCRSIRSLHMI